MSGLHRRCLLLRSKAAIVVEDMQSNTEISLITRMKCLSKGFLSRSYFLYDLENKNYKYYLSDYERKKTRFINEEDAIILNNKIIFDSMARDRIKTPTIYSIILNGKIYPYYNKVKINNSDELIDQIKKEGKIVLKPYIGADGGEGIYICEYIDGNLLFNGNRVEKLDIDKIINKLNKYIVTEYIEQHEYSSTIFPDSVNTIRIITMEDPNTQEVFMPIAIHRIGTSGTKNVDNWDKGGLSAKVDIDTGILGKATCKSINNKMKWYSNHPDTNAQIEGIEIPSWDIIREKIFSLAESMPFLKYVGWDVVVTKDSEVSIIEANNCSGVNVLQVHEPLLLDERIEDFYKYYKII